MVNRMDFYFVFIFVKLLSSRVLQFLLIFCLVCFVFLVSIKSTFHPFVTFTFFVCFILHVFVLQSFTFHLVSVRFNDDAPTLLVCFFFVTVHTFK